MGLVLVSLSPTFGKLTPALPSEMDSTIRWASDC